MKRILRTNLFFSLLFLLVCDCNAQTFLNGSFENTTSPPSCNYNLNNSYFNSLMPNVTAYGSGNETDIMVAGCYVPTIPDGTYCVALAADPSDEIALTLSAPFISGNSYTFTFWGYSDVTLRPQGDLEIGLSATSSNFGTLIYTANTIPATWIQYTVTFVAPITANYITVRNIAGAIHWNRIDDFSFDQPSPILHLGNDTTLCQGDNLILNATVPNATYLWQDNSTNSTFTAAQPGTYWVQATVNATIQSDTINIESKKCEVPILDMPNVFTPDNDGKNEFFNPIVISGIDKATLIIFNRWGQKLIETNNITRGWNGKFKSEDCPDGIYYWIVKYTDFNNSEKTMTGFLSLIRGK